MTRWLASLMLVGSTRIVPSAFQGTKIPPVIRPEAAGRRVGLASWCGRGERLHRYVAMGHRFNPQAFEAAMWDVPFGTMVNVRNRENGRSAIVRITDRGPARRLRTQRAIDLSRRAFAELAPLQQGLIPVAVQRLP